MRKQENTMSTEETTNEVSTIINSADMMSELWSVIQDDDSFAKDMMDVLSEYFAREIDYKNLGRYRVPSVRAHLDLAGYKDVTLATGDALAYFLVSLISQTVKRKDRDLHDNTNDEIKAVLGGREVAEEDIMRSEIEDVLSSDASLINDLMDILINYYEQRIDRDEYSLDAVKAHLESSNWRNVSYRISYALAFFLTYIVSRGLDKGDMDFEFFWKEAFEYTQET